MGPAGMIDCGYSAQCHGKVTFDSPGLARSVLDRQARQRRKRKRSRHEDEIPSQAYRCRHCGKWHLGRPLVMERVR